MSKGKFKIGIDVGGTKTAYGLYDEKLQLIAYEKHRTDNNASQEEFTDSIRDVILLALLPVFRALWITGTGRWCLRRPFRPYVIIMLRNGLLRNCPEYGSLWTMIPMRQPWQNIGSEPEEAMTTCFIHP